MKSEKKLDEYRKDAAKILEELIDFGLSARDLAAFLPCSYRSIYLWMSSNAFIPNIDLVPSILKLDLAVKKIECNSLEAVTWTVANFHNSTNLFIFKGRALKILKDKNLSAQEKAKALTIATVKEWAKNLEVKK